LAPVTTVCHSCGRDGEAVVPVRRVYLTLPDWDREERVEVLDEIEQWCSVCREHYPHQLLDESDG
jgi:thymidine kinase